MYSKMDSLLINSNTRATVYLPSTPLSGMTAIECSSQVEEVNLKPSTISAVTGAVSSSEKKSHVVTIQISQKDEIINQQHLKVNQPTNILCKSKVSFISFGQINKDETNKLKNNLISEDMVQKSNVDLEVSSPTYLYYMMNSGQCSPSDTLDSGTCSDLETPPPLPKKMSPKSKITHNNNGDKQQIITRHNRNGSLTDSEESESSLSCDSLNCSELTRKHRNKNENIPTPPTMPNLIDDHDDHIRTTLRFLPDSLLKDIRDSSSKLTLNVKGEKSKTNIEIRSYISKNEINNHVEVNNVFENDKFYKFHINENVNDVVERARPSIIEVDESFAGYKDIHSGTSTIRSSKGTIRGVKNRVRNGIATFLQMQLTNVKNYKEKDSGKVVLYTTSMGIVRETYAKCANMKQILRTLLVKFEERDVFMSNEYQKEIKDRMQCDEMDVPQLFVDGQHIGDADYVERLNETGELRKMLKPYKCFDSSFTCQMCGGYRLLPCPSCNGSKKSVHRNHFTTEFVALKCMNCDEVGLVKCYNC